MISALKGDGVDDVKSVMSDYMARGAVAFSGRSAL